MNNAGLIALLGVGAYLYWENQNQASAPVAMAPIPPYPHPTNAQVGNMIAYGVPEVQTHNDAPGGIVAPRTPILIAPPPPGDNSGGILVQPRTPILIAPGYTGAHEEPPVNFRDQDAAPPPPSSSAGMIPASYWGRTASGQLTFRGAPDDVSSQPAPVVGGEPARNTSANPAARPTGPTVKLYDFR